MLIKVTVTENIKYFYCRLSLRPCDFIINIPIIYYTTEMFILKRSNNISVTAYIYIFICLHCYCLSLDLSRDNNLCTFKIVSLQVFVFAISTVVDNNIESLSLSTALIIARLQINEFRHIQRYQLWIITLIITIQYRKISKTMTNYN